MEFPMGKLGPSWLRDAVFYEIYPSSFYDSNGDGIGDIPGIIAKLDYLTALGVNAVWLNPCFVSPFCDGGYDIADYRQVAPRFGTNDDLFRLFAEAKKRNIKICLDMVPGHTSTEHPWFKASCQPEENPYSNYYIWNNSWLAPTDGLRMISGSTDRNGSFMINYFAMQPALNYGFANPNPEYPWQLPTDHPDVLKVREELKNNMRVWLEKGCDGFRVDMAPSLVKKDPGKKATMALWREVREMFDREYPECALIAEWAYPPQSLKAGFHCDFQLHCGTPGYTTLFRNEPERDLFNVSGLNKNTQYEDDGNDYTVTNRHSFFDAAGLGDAKAFFDIYMRHYELTRNDGYISIPSGDHDMPRISDFRDKKDLACVFAFLMTMPGVPFVYYGDEIGMRNIPNLISKEGGFTRTQARTPMQWDAGNNAGFSAAPAEKLFLPVDRASDAPNVSDQMSRADSLWHEVQKLIDLRKSTPALHADSELILLQADYPLVYLRRNKNDYILTVIQPARRKWECNITLPVAAQSLESLKNCNISAEVCGTLLHLSGDDTQYGIWKIIR